jgi:hypothetical protein
VCRSSEGFHGWQETATENLCLRSDFLVGEGWSGFIARGTYEGHPVAVKLAPVYSGRAEVSILSLGGVHLLEISGYLCCFLVCTSSPQ